MTQYHKVSAIINTQTNAHSGLLVLCLCGTYRGHRYQNPGETREDLERAIMLAVEGPDGTVCDCEENGCKNGRTNPHKMTVPVKRTVAVGFRDSNYFRPGSPENPTEPVTLPDRKGSKGKGKAEKAS